jgi:uncharacterized C2H2 Zn-finger protein
MTDSVGQVLITCPKTGLPVETVFRLRQAALDALQGEHRFRCARCGEVHAWRKEDAWLAGDRSNHR